MSNIQENLQKILSAVWGRDVRQAIHDAIHDCYEDGSAGAIDLTARESISQETTTRTADISAVNGRIDSINTDISNIQSDLNSIKRSVVMRDITIPTGGGGISQTIVDFSNDLPSNAHIVGIDMTIGDFHLPYVRDNNVVTWVAKMWEHAVRIDNTSSLWDNYRMYATLFYIEESGT